MGESLIVVCSPQGNISLIFVSHVKYYNRLHVPVSSEGGILDLEKQNFTIVLKKL